MIPAQMIGSAVANALSVFFGIEPIASHGGIFILPMINESLFWLLAGAIRVAVTTMLVLIFKPNLSEEQLQGSELAALDLG